MSDTAQLPPLPDWVSEPAEQPKRHLTVSSGLKWLPTGEVANKFVWSPVPVTGIMGPYGSGKTTALFLKGLVCSLAVPPSPIDGVRYTRGAVVRDTYRNLETNTIPSWEERFPKDLGTWRGGSGGEPARAVIIWDLDDGTTLNWEVLFVALGDHNIKEFCDGLQLTWCGANGIDVLPREMFESYMEPRLARFPPPHHRPPNWDDYVPRACKLFGDMNAPDIDNWTYEDFVESPLPGFKLFVQPGGMDPKAENKHNLRRDYYENMVARNKKRGQWWMNRFVHNKFGYSRSGTPVYPEWNDTIHVAEIDIAYDPKRDLLIGLDAGRDPRAIAIQKSFMGRIDVLDELVPEQRMGAKKFGKVLSDWIAEKFPKIERVIGYADPSAANATDLTDDDEEFWISVVSKVAQFQIKAAPSNALEPRLEAVRDALTALDGEPMFRLSPRCKVLRKGFNSGYRYIEEDKKGMQDGEALSATTPLKNIYSHPHDALQYVCLGASDWRQLTTGRKGDGGGQTREETSWDLHG